MPPFNLHKKALCGIIMSSNQINTKDSSMDTQVQILNELKKLTTLLDEANAQRESLLVRAENLDAKIKVINENLAYLTSHLTTKD